MFTMLLRIALGLAFIWSGTVKVLNPDAFAEIVFNYQMLPDALINLTALILPWVEIICGLALVIGKFVRGASLTICGLMVIFIAAMFFNYARGLDISCGCFSLDSDTSDLSLTIMRDSAILLVGAIVLRKALYKPIR